MHILGLDFSLLVPLNRILFLWTESSSGSLLILDTFEVVHGSWGLSSGLLTFYCSLLQNEVSSTPKMAALHQLVELAQVYKDGRGHPFIGPLGPFLVRYVWCLCHNTTQRNISHFSTNWLWFWLAEYVSVFTCSFYPHKMYQLQPFTTLIKCFPEVFQAQICCVMNSINYGNCNFCMAPLQAPNCCYVESIK